MVSRAEILELKHTLVPPIDYANYYTNRERKVESWNFIDVNPYMLNDEEVLKRIEHGTIDMRYHLFVKDWRGYQYYLSRIVGRLLKISRNINVDFKMYWNTSTHKNLAIFMRKHYPSPLTLKFCQRYFTPTMIWIMRPTIILDLMYRSKIWAIPLIRLALWWDWLSCIHIH